MSGFLQLFAAPTRYLFSRPAIAAYYLWVELLFVVMVASEAVFLTTFFRLSLSGQGTLIASLPVIMLMILWFGILRAHQAIHQKYRDKWAPNKGESEDDPRVDMLLDKIAFLSYTGFIYAVTAVLFAYAALVPSIAVARK